MRGEGYLQDFTPLGPDFSGLSGGGDLREFLHTEQSPVTLNVTTLEGSSGNHVGGDSPLDTVPKLWHVHACGKDDPAPTDR